MTAAPTVFLHAPTAEDFDAWFAAHHAYLIAIARRYVAAPDGEDVAQQAWANAWRARVTFRGAASPRSWLYRITVNAAMTHHRRGRRSVTASEPLEAAAPMVDSGDRPDDLAQRQERRRWLAQAFRTLSSSERIAIGCVDVHGAPYSEVSTALGVPLGTIKSRVNRGRRRLCALRGAQVQ